jgi:hypothetical protein
MVSGHSSWKQAEDNYAEPINKGTMLSFFKSYYVDDTAFILSQPRRRIAASKLIVSHLDVLV